MDSCCDSFKLACQFHVLLDAKSRLQWDGATTYRHSFTPPLQLPADLAGAGPCGWPRCESTGVLQTERRTSLLDEDADGRAIRAREKLLGGSANVPRLSGGGYPDPAWRPVISLGITHLCRGCQPSLRSTADPGPRPRGSGPLAPETRPSLEPSLETPSVLDPHSAL
jgi:hypothetical protein